MFDGSLEMVAGSGKIARAVLVSELEIPILGEWLNVFPEIETRG